MLLTSVVLATLNSSKKLGWAYVTFTMCLMWYAVCTHVLFRAIVNGNISVTVIISYLCADNIYHDLWLSGYYSCGPTMLSFIDNSARNFINFKGKCEVHLM